MSALVSSSPFNANALFLLPSLLPPMPLGALTSEIRALVVKPQCNPVYQVAFQRLSKAADGNPEFIKPLQHPLVRPEEIAECNRAQYCGPLSRRYEAFAEKLTTLAPDEAFQALVDEQVRIIDLGVSVAAGILLPTVAMKFLTVLQDVNAHSTNDSICDLTNSFIPSPVLAPNMGSTRDGVALLAEQGDKNQFLILLTDYSLFAGIFCLLGNNEYPILTGACFALTVLGLAFIVGAPVVAKTRISRAVGARVRAKNEAVFNQQKTLIREIEARMNGGEVEMGAYRTPAYYLPDKNEIAVVVEASVGVANSNSSHFHAR